MDFNSLYLPAKPVVGRSFVHTQNYWQVYFDTNMAIRRTFGAAGHPAAEAHLFVRQKAA
jgi:small conductance mechanosensitive channel